MSRSLRRRLGRAPRSSSEEIRSKCICAGTMELERRNIFGRNARREELGVTGRMVSGAASVKRL